MGSGVPVETTHVLPDDAVDPGMNGMPCRFGKYTLIRRLASGGMAELFLALQRSVAGFEKLLVIKRILPAMHQDQAFIDMLLHEARVAATLSHPNIVQIFDVGEADGHHFIAMEHIHGEDLRSIARQIKKSGGSLLPIEHALSVVLGVCAGLAHAHEKRGFDGSHLGIVHRDISPQNIIVTFTGDVKIVDFGIAKSHQGIGEQTKSGRLKGKIPYMSPEQARGERVDARTDLFAAGVVLFELVTGKRLFRGRSDYETLTLICDRPYPKPSEVCNTIAPDLERVILRALAKDPADRYQSALEMHADLEAYVRRHRISISSLALHKYMQGLFEDKLALQKAAISQGKQLADVIESLAGVAPYPSEPDLCARPSTSNVSTAPSALTVVDGRVPSRRPNMRGALTVAASIAAVCTVALVSMAGWFATRRNAVPDVYPARNVEASPPSLGPGQIAIESDPPGAFVWVGDTELSGVTPVTVEGVTPGKEFHVRIAKEGYVSAEEVAMVEPGGRERVKVVLSPKSAPQPASELSREPAAAAPVVVSAALPRATGKLNVGVSHGWCELEVDGRSHGPTPVAGLVLGAGAHRVRCRTSSRVLDAVVVVRANDTTRFRFAL